AFFADNLPREFVVRPAEHAAGRRACFFYREGDAFIGAAMARLDAGELYDWLASDHTVRHVIQERLYCHPELTRLSGEESLQPVRIITLIDNDGQVHILHAHLKILRTDETTDPRDGGLAGGIEAPIDLRHGVLEKANRIPGTGAPAVTVGSHPRTGVAFEGFRVPFWTELCRLARHAALKFIPVRTIGWDVALTSDGPIILEGDLWWEPPNQHGDMAEIFRVLSDPSLPRIQRSESIPADGDHWRNLFTADDRA
ncbi:MAG: sugar-transfer associated ATP-grasp domain-containing protein, partial [Solirubrobacterales bacterium]